MKIFIVDHFRYDLRGKGETAHALSRLPSLKAKTEDMKEKKKKEVKKKSMNVAQVAAATPY